MASPNVRALRRFEVVPPYTRIFERSPAVDGTVYDPVMAPALIPNEIPFAFEKAFEISVPVAFNVSAWVLFQSDGLFSYNALSGVVIESTCETVAGMVSYAGAV